MKYYTRRFSSLILFVIFGFSFLSAQNTTITFDWNGSPNWQSGDCNICGNDYACSNNFGDWMGGIKQFNDPIPTGNLITGITVTINLTGCGASLSDVLLNGQIIGTFAPVQDCTCPTSCDTKTVTFNTSPNNYNYGGFNNFQLSPQGGAGAEICVDNAVVNFAYSCQSSTAPGGISGNTIVTQGNSTTLTVSGGSLAPDATWEWYEGSCGTIPVGTGSSITVSPLSTTTYFVRAEGGCNTTACASVNVQVNASGGGGGPCANDNIAFDNNTYTPPCGPSSVLSVGPGTFLQVNVVDGANYWFSTCGTGYDTKLTGYNGNTLVVFNDDNGPDCAGVEASLNWVSNFTGVLTMNVDDEFCLGLNPGSAVLEYWQEDNLQTTNSTNNMCAGMTRDLTALPEGGTFSGQFVSGTTFSPPSNAAGGDYDITYTLGACTEIQTITVDANSQAPSSITGNTNVCPGGSTILTVSGGSLGANAEWEWFVGNCGGVPIGSGNSISFSPISDTTIWVRAEGLCNFTACASIDLTLLDAPNGRIDGTTSICVGESTDLTFNFTLGTGPFNVTYSDGLSNTNLTGINTGHTESVSPTQTTTYTFVSITDANGCSRTSNFGGASQITVLPLPNVTSVNATDVSCNGDSDGQIVITASGGAGNYQYSIDSGNTYQASNTFTGLAVGSYDVAVQDGNGCSQAYNGNPVVISEPVVLAMTVDTTIDASCDGVFDGEIEVTVTGGTQPYSYSLNNGPVQPSNRFTGLSAQTYDILVIDANGCTTTQTAVLGNTFIASLTLIDQTDVTCSGGSDGSLTVSASGGVAPYVYSLNGGPNQSDSTFSGLPAGSYTVGSRDSRGCEASLNVVIQELTPLAITLDSTTTVLCNGDASGDLLVTVSGGTAPYVYAWSDGSTTEDLNGVGAGTYTLTATDDNGCTAVETFEISEPDELQSNFASIDSVSCNGGSDGRIDITIVGGVNPYTFAWSNGATTEDIINVTAGTYTITVTDANNCTYTSSADVEEPTAIALTLTGTDVTCSGADDGSTDLTVSGGVAPYEFLWSNGAITEDLASIGGGTYTVVVTDANGCRESMTIDIFEPDALVAIFIVTNTACNGASTGAIDLTVTGGNGGNTFSWSNGETTEDLTGLSGGVYAITITDSVGCILIDSVEVDEPLVAITGMVEATDVSCNGAADGEVDLTINGGTLPYIFTWSNGATTEDIEDLGPGTYTIDVTDANGCTFSGSDTVSEPDALTSVIVATDVSCFGAGDGSADLTVTGGIAPYTYLWSTFQNTQDISGLEANTYFVIITDQNDCNLFDSVTINEAAEITLDFDATHVSCNGESDGAIDLTANGGIMPFDFMWSNGDSTEDLSGLSGGIYTVTLTDSTACVAIDSVEVAEPSELAITGTKEDISCFGENDGSVDITTTGGMPPYSFEWSNGDSTEDLSGVGPGSYSITVTDANGCTITGPANILEPAPLQLQISATDASCDGANDGSIDLTVTGGTAPYDYNWSTGDTTEDLSNLNPGIYIVIVSDANDCERITTIEVEEPDQMRVNFDVRPVSCNGAGDGSITALPVGGTMPYAYNWSTSDSVAMIDSLSPGTYLVTVTDSNGCTAIDSADMVEPEMLSIIPTVTAVTCFNGNDGVIDLEVEGGNPPYTFEWADSAGNVVSTDEDLVNAASGDYTVVVSDAKGCSETDTFNLNEPVLLGINIVGEDATCFGLCDGSGSVTITGGTAPYIIQWPDNFTGPTRHDLCPDTYVIIVQDQNGCINSKAVQINGPTEILVTDTTADLLCNGDANGFIDITVTGGVGGYSYDWSDGSTTQDLAGINGGSYTVTVTDTNFCSVTGEYELNEPGAILGETFGGNPECFGSSDGFAAVSVDGGTLPYSFEWSTGESSVGISDLEAAVYTVTITDGNGCILTDSIEVVEADELVITLNQDDVDCVRDGNVEVSVEGGKEPFLYSLNGNDQLDSSFPNLGPGTYVLNVEDANGCKSLSEFQIFESSTFVLDIGEDIEIFRGEVIPLGADIQAVNPIVDYSWIPGDGLSCADCPDPEASPDETTTYVLSVTDSDGCTVMDTMTVYVLTNQAIFVPTGFSPNGDGLNETFDINIVGAANVEVRIFSRWGEEVYHNPSQENGIGFGWDGTHKDKQVPMGSYVYTFTISNFDGTTTLKEGTVTVVR